MIGSFLTRGLVMAFGYAYPAYECFKTVEKNKPEIEQLRFWCQYWILVAVLAVFERIGDALISWIPMYSEAKLAFYIYLWYPKTKGTTYVYDSFFKPYVAKHETEIDRNLLELRTRAGDIVILYWQRMANYGHTRVFEILQYVALQSTPRPRSAEETHSKVDSGMKAAPTLEKPTQSLKPTEDIKNPEPGTDESPTPSRDAATDENKVVAPPNTVPLSNVESMSVVPMQPSDVGPPKTAVVPSNEVAENPSVAMPKSVILRSTRVRLRRARDGAKG